MDGVYREITSIEVIEIIKWSIITVTAMIIRHIEKKKLKKKNQESTAIAVITAFRDGAKSTKTNGIPSGKL